MNENEKKALDSIFGKDFSLSEQERLLQENPDLPSAAEALREHVLDYASQSIPPLSSDFTAKVMEKTLRPGFWETVRQNLHGWRRLTLASSLAAAVLAGLIVGPKFFRRDSSGILVREEVLAEGERRFWVRFAIRLPEAKTIELAGDFNQWNPVKVTRENDGTFTLELPLEEGTYAYSFLVDGKNWIPDPAADRKIADGFGNVNSLINL